MDYLLLNKPPIGLSIDKTLVDFLTQSIEDKFPDIEYTNRDTLLIHKGKLELVKSITKLYEKLHGIK
jgi:hypothetical protein